MKLLDKIEQSLDSVIEKIDEDTTSLKKEISEGLDKVEDLIETGYKSFLHELYEIGEDLGLVGAKGISGGNAGALSADWALSDLIKIDISINGISQEVTTMTTLRIDQKNIVVSAKLTDTKKHAAVLAAGIAATWVSSNPAVLTVTPSDTDPTKATITLVDVGTADVTYTVNSNPNSAEPAVIVSETIHIEVVAGLAVAATLEVTAEDDLAADGVATEAPAAAPAPAEATAA